MGQKLSPTDISELICTRLSHDIIGNIGAVSNAVELLEEGDADFMDDIKSILKTSSAVLTARLKFFRMAFGLNNAAVNDLPVVETAIRNYLQTVGSKNYPIELEVKVQSPDLGKILMLESMLAADIMIKGGKISIVQNGYKLYLKVSGVGKLSAEKTEILSAVVLGQGEEKAAQYAPAYYLKEILDEAGLSVKTNIADAETFEMLVE